MDPSAGFLIVTWKRLTVHSARCYIIATRLLGDNDVSGDVLSIWRRTTTSSDPPGGSEDFFFVNMLKTAALFIVAESVLRRRNTVRVRFFLSRLCWMPVMSMLAKPAGVTKLRSHRDC